MANAEHVAVLKRGAVAWNVWRSQHPNPNLVPDLSGGNFSNTALFNVQLNGAILDGADLTRAGLIGANLLQYAKLRGAKLVRCHLPTANLLKADLTGADLTEALFGETILGQTMLRDAVGLETCVHHGASILDFATATVSGGIEIAFLRGCGWPDELIQLLRSLAHEAVTFHSCFISYSTRDQAFANRLHADLQDKGVRSWFAPEELKIGDPFRQRIDEAIRLHEKLLVILSEHSVQSDWVREEVEACLEREGREKRSVLFPVRLDDTVMDTDQAWVASIRRQRHIGDFRQWKDHHSYKKAFQRLLEDLKA